MKEGQIYYYMQVKQTWQTLPWTSVNPVGHGCSLQAAVSAKTHEPLIGS